MATDYWAPFEEECIYHLYNHAVGDEDLFRGEGEKRFTDCLNFMSKYEKYFAPYFETYAYCLMPNHFHILIKVKKVNEEITSCIVKEGTVASEQFLEGETSLNYFISDQMRRFFSSYALVVKSKYKRRGPLFQEKCKHVFVDKEKRLDYMLCYIHHNPIHHGFTKEYSDWKFSSYSSYLSNQKTNVARAEILEWTAGVDGFLKLHKEFKLDMGEYLNLD